METPETRYAKARDGVSLAYQVLGDGPVDLLWLEGYRGHLEVMWEQPLVASFYSQLASFSRLIRLDVRGSGLSDRGDRPADLETQVDDIRAVLDIVGSQRTVIVAGGWGTAPASPFAGTFPDRCRRSSCSHFRRATGRARTTLGLLRRGDREFLPRG